MDNTKQHDPATDAVDPRYPNTPIGIVRSRDAFLRDLPALLVNPKYDRWSVAYLSDQRIGIAESEIELLLECKRRGLHPDQYFIGCIFPHGGDDEEVDFGFHEFEEVDDEVTNCSPDAPKSIP